MSSQTHVNVSVTIADLTRPDFWEGHSDIFADSAPKACIIFTVPIFHVGSIDELVNAILDNINASKWNLIQDMVDYQLSQITSKMIIDAINERGNDLAYYKDEMNTLLDEIESNPENEEESVDVYLYGWVHVWENAPDKTN